MRQKKFTKGPAYSGYGENITTYTIKRLAPREDWDRIVFEGAFDFGMFEQLYAERVGWTDFNL